MLCGSAMALFALWRAHLTAPEPLARMHDRLAEAAHVDPALAIARPIETRTGRWNLSAFLTATRFYEAEAQLWLDPAGGACLIHGLLWRAGEAHPKPLDAAAIGALLARPEDALPDDIAGEYAVARLFPSGALSAFADTAGLHQLFLREGRADLVANRAGFISALAGDGGPDPQAGAWIATIGYRVGARTSRRGVTQLPPDRMIAGGRIIPRPGSLAVPPGPRGFEHGGERLLEEGMAQARAAVRLAGADGGAIDLPVTGGKDSRAVLALCVAAGLRDHLHCFTRGYAHSPDVIAGAALAGALGLPHRREPPLGSDAPADLDLEGFHAGFARLAFQTDGNMGGWDMITARRTGTDTLLTGHLGELLKAYAKRALPPDLDPIALVRLQAPFDPLEVLRPDARSAMAEQLADGMAAERAGGATEADLPDLFYLRHRIPNWLGGIRGIKSFERQPVLPLGVPALTRLALLMTSAERRVELAHYRIVAAGAPALLPLAFAHQRWDAALPGAPQVDPVLVPAGEPLFGNWQYSINRRPELRQHLAQLFAATDLELWDRIDRAAVIERLQHRTVDYFDGIALLGLTVAVYYGAGLLLTERLASPDAASVRRPAPPMLDPALQVAP